MIENFRLRVFRAVARHLNFSRAAEDLLLTQPAVTQQIKALEEELGVSLFDRGGGPIQLTAAGKVLLSFADRLREVADEALAALAAVSGEQGGPLALGASQTIAQYVLPGLIAAFRRSHPRVEVTARSGNTDAMLEALLSGSLHLALIEGPEQRRELHVEPFMQDEMVLVVPAGHEWADQQVTPGMLAAEPLLLREIGSGSRRVVEQALARCGLRLKGMRLGMEFDSTEGLLSAVEAGLGAAFASQWAVRKQIALGSLRVVRVDGLRLTRWFSLARPAGPSLRGSAEAFRSLLLACREGISPPKVSRAEPRVR